MGTFHKMSVKHMDRYLEELEWRFNKPYKLLNPLRIVPLRSRGRSGLRR